ncbi:MAG: ABC transporter substrate-binding protein [Clostridia bacterium]|nr:ABC transporter substrate-binding protein [Clostridia bacterium]
MSKKIISLILSVIFVIGVFASCSKDSSPEPAPMGDKVDVKNGGKINIGCVPVDTLNPLVTQHASVADFLSLVYEGLFVTNPDLSVEPVLAESYTVSGNNTTYTIKLKENVKFHNGKSFVARDVIATLDYLKEHQTRWSDVVKYIENYSERGNYTVVIKLNTPKSDFAANFDFPILPNGLPEEDFENPNQNFVPVGTGMYKYDTTVAYKKIVLKSYEGWMGGTDKAYIDEVDVEIMSDEETIISAFDAGTLDVLTTSWRSLGDLTLSSSLFNTFSCEQNRFSYVGINTESEIFDDVNERRELLDSIDNKKITEDIMISNGIVATSPVRDSVYFNVNDNDEPAVKQSDKNTGSAERTPIECKILYNSDSKTKNRMAASLKQQLEASGYIVILDGNPKSSYLDKVAAGEYDLYIGEVQMTGSCDLSFMFSSPSGGFCNYDDKEFRALLTNLDSVVGEKEKEVAWENFEKYYLNSAVQVPLFFTNKAVFVNKRISGALKPNLSTYFYKFDDMFIKKD